MEEAAILAAIAQFPEEDTPRLAYADWLDDHADALPDPEAARIRAEFIRLQCELKRYEDVSRVEQDRYIELYRRQDAILTRHRGELLGPLGEALRTNLDVVFDRGFVSELRLHSAILVKHLEQILSIQPRPDVTVWSASATIRELVESRPGPQSLVTSLRMLGPGTPAPGGIDFALSRELLRDSGKWQRLRQADLSGCLSGDILLRDIGQAVDALPVLTYLDFSFNEISDEGVRWLVESPLWPRLNHLVLDANPISDAGAELLANAATAAPRLEYLNLKRTGITSEGHRVLFRRFPRRTKLDLF